MPPLFATLRGTVPTSDKALFDAVEAVLPPLDPADPVVPDNDAGALGWGLAFSTFISLFTIPSALAVAADVGSLARRLVGARPRAVN